MSGETSPEEVAGWIAESLRITALTDAGISTDSGIPDFRGPQGVWTRVADAVFCDPIGEVLPGLII